MTAPHARALAYLECYAEAGGPAERIPLLKLPFTIGRSDTADHTVYSSKVSKEHAQIVLIDDRYAVRDLDSTNGTFVNGRRTVEQVLEDGDIIHVAHLEFCFRQQASARHVTSSPGGEAVERTQLVFAAQPDSIIRGTELLREMISTEAVEILYQPIVDLRTRMVVGYEALGRGKHSELNPNPEVLLRLADQCGMVVELSRLFARRAVASSNRLPPGTKVFVNIHPSDLASPDLLQSLTTLRALAFDDHTIVMEIAESSVTDSAAMAENREAFTRLGLEFAYDDFGAGQARLLELADIPPDYLKFDKAMIQGIEAAPSRQELIRALLRVVRRLGVRVIAEGIETELVATTCQRLGCDLGQGYLFGHPLSH